MYRNGLIVANTQIYIYVHFWLSHLAAIEQEAEGCSFYRLLEIVNVAEKMLNYYIFKWVLLILERVQWQ